MTITHLLLDIEGTTCPVSFVSEVLFPYAKQSLSSYLNDHEEDPDLKNILQAADREWDADPSPDSINRRQASRKQNLNFIDSIKVYFEHLINIDGKSTALKDLQGKIWNNGYKRGEIKSHLYDETTECLRRWHSRKMSLSVYSSGSIQAQKLLYRHTKGGDLVHLFDHWFDTHTGNKKEANSYHKIATKINTNSSNILFISDNGAECDSAKASGMKVLFSLRDGNPDQNPRGHRVIKTLNDVDAYL